MTDPQTLAELKASVRRAAGERCQRCGLDSAAHYDRFGTTLFVTRLDNAGPWTEGNAEALCRSCLSSKPRVKATGRTLHDRAERRAVERLLTPATLAGLRWWGAQNGGGTEADAVRAAVDRLLKGK